MSGFWLMMYQLWDLQPNFIADWIDSRPVAESLSFLPEWAYDSLTQETSRGRQIPQNVILSLNSMFIILGVVGMGWITRKMRTLTAMLWGMLICAAGVLVAGLTMNPWILFAGIACFSVGEMLTGPKKSEYLALIAPPGKKGLYLGYVNIPVGIGVFIGSKIAGYVYGNYGEKATLALKYLVEKTDTAKSAAWDGTIGHLEKILGVTRPDAMTKLQEVTGLDATAATKLLWDTYSPQYNVWVPFAAVGLVSAIALWVFGQMAKRWSDMNA
jgi:proton-dependent oligopeptide transporter, POT family